MLDNEDYIEITKAYLDDEINDIAFYMMMFKGFDGFTCTTSPCKVCGDRIIPMNNQTSTSYCEICYTNIDIDLANDEFLLAERES